MAAPTEGGFPVGKWSPSARYDLRTTRGVKPDPDGPRPRSGRPARRRWPKSPCATVPSGVARQQDPADAQTAAFHEPGRQHPCRVALPAPRGHDVIADVAKVPGRPGFRWNRYRNRTDGLRITRRIRAVHGRPGGHTCLLAASRSARVRGSPGPLLANPLAQPVRDHRPGASPSPAAPRRVGPYWRPHARRVRGRQLRVGFPICAFPAAGLVSGLPAFGVIAGLPGGSRMTTPDELPGPPT